MFSSRMINIYGFIIALTSMLVAYIYFQQTLGYEPCSLCMLQRVAMCAAGGVFFIAAIADWMPGLRRVFALMTLAFSLVGVGIAWRHVWLQGLPPEQVPACTGDIGYLMEISGIGGMLKEILVKSGSCADVDWSLFGLSIPAWVLITFLGLVALSLIQIIRKD